MWARYYSLKVEPLTKRVRIGGPVKAGGLKMQFCMFMFKGCSFTVMVWMAITPKWPATELLSTNRHPFFSLPQLLVFKPWEENMDVCVCVFFGVPLFWWL